MPSAFVSKVYKRPVFRRFRFAFTGIKAARRAIDTVTAYDMCSECLSRLQAPAQAFLRPGLWFFGVRNVHVAREVWEIPGCTPSKCLESLLSAVEKVADSEPTGQLHVHKADHKTWFCQIFSLTRTCGWLDVVEIQFRPGQDEGTEASAVSFSTGVLPVNIPLAFIWNAVLFWVPFSGNGFNRKRLAALRQAMECDVSYREVSTC